MLLIVQARFNSSRLPGKILLPLDGLPVLQHVIHRAGLCPLPHQRVVATSDTVLDDPVPTLCDRLKTDCFRGSEANVLERFYQAALPRRPDIVVRLTGDNPLFDGRFLQPMAEQLQAEGLDYLSIGHRHGYPIGFSAEMFRFAALEEAYRKAGTEHEREHVTPYILQRPEQFRIGYFPPGANDYSHYRWTLDEPDDYRFLEAVVPAIHARSGPDYTYADLIALLAERLDLAELNRHVTQRG